MPDKLQPHQSRVIKKLDTTNGLVVNHGTGSGKTLTALLAAHKALKKNPGGQVLYLSPASITGRVDEEIRKHKIPIDRDRLVVRSYEKAINDREELGKGKYSLVIADEAHKLRNTDTLRYRALSDIIRKADKRLLMTATTQYNQPYDLAPLVNLASGKKELPEGKEFNSKYLEIRRTNPGWIRRVLLGIKPEENVNIKNQKQLSAILSKYTDKHEDLAGEFFPEKSEKIVPVPMSKEQHQIYKAIEGKLPFLLRLKVRSGMPLDKKELANLNAFSTGMRQVSNTAAPYLNNYNPDTHSPKIDAALASLSEKAGLDKNFRGVVYSNYLDAGLKQYSEKLKKAKIPHSIYTGELTKAQKQKLVDEYNSGKSPVMLISSAGGEGLDLKGTKLIQVLEPHFNHSKIDQVVGRGARFKSHSHLPKEERKVEIEHFHSTFPDGVFGKSKDLTIDQYLHGVGSKKADIKDKIQEIIGN